ncbi:MAG: hypothetical protein KDH09_05295, partial [Chrysiogenetes bacterium]|nr:hypothetical protein [Chrysiogenetes bacterium]
EIERDAGGEVIFEDYARVGILRIERAGKQGSKAKIDSLVDLGNTVKVGDLVSPAPIPERPPVIYTSPKLADYVGGEVIVQDDYSGERMVGVNNNREDAYQGGQLVLDATHKDNGHAYGFYPNSLSATDFILEFEMEWLSKDTDRLNRLAVSLRSNGDYLEENSYVVKFYQDNTYDFFAWVDGHRKWIQENTTSIGMEVDDGDENMVRIVAVGPDVELYLNDKFIAGFTDERFDHGVIGLAVTQGCKVGVDDLVMRKPVKKKAGE